MVTAKDSKGEILGLYSYEFRAVTNVTCCPSVSKELPSRPIQSLLLLRIT
jgi:hypothetical protein